MNIGILNKEDEAEVMDSTVADMTLSEIALSSQIDVLGMEADMHEIDVMLLKYSVNETYMTDAEEKIAAIDTGMEADDDFSGEELFGELKVSLAYLGADEDVIAGLEADKEGFVEKAKNILKKVLDYMKNFLKKIWNAMKRFFSSVADMVTSLDSKVKRVVERAKEAQKKFDKAAGKDKKLKKAWKDAEMGSIKIPKTYKSGSNLNATKYAADVKDVADSAVIIANGMKAREEARKTVIEKATKVVAKLASGKSATSEKAALTTAQSAANAKTPKLSAYGASGAALGLATDVKKKTADTEKMTIKGNFDVKSLAGDLEAAGKKVSGAKKTTADIKKLVNDNEKEMAKLQKEVEKLGKEAIKDPKLMSSLTDAQSIVSGISKGNFSQVLVTLDQNNFAKVLGHVSKLTGVVAAGAARLDKLAS